MYVDLIEVVSVKYICEKIGNFSVTVDMHQNSTLNLSLYFCVNK